MKIAKYIIFLLLIVFIGISIYVAVQPNSYEVSRTRTINAPAEVIYDNIIDFKNWEAWSAWAERDPDLKITLPEQTKGVGGYYSWEDKDGIGTMKTTSTEPYSSIEQEMQFDDFEPSDVNWIFELNEEGGTKVTWIMKGDKIPFMFKAYSAMSGGFDKMIGPDFERGLEKLDSVVTASMSKYEITIDGIKEYGGGFYLYKTINANNSNISQIMGQQYGSLMAYMGTNNIAMNGMPMTVYHEMNNEAGTVIMSNGIPVREKIEVSEDSDILCGYMPKMKVLKGTLLGNYTNLGAAWSALMQHLSINNLVQSDDKPFEIYSNDPGNFPNPADWKTELYIPLKD